MDVLLGGLDDLKVSLLEGLVYRTPGVTFKLAGEVFDTPAADARALVDDLGRTLGQLYELATR